MLEQKFYRPDAGLALTTAPSGLEITGYASVFGIKDQGGDVVMKGAYRRCLERLSQKSGKIAMLWQHDPHAPIGIWEDLVEDEHGLRVTGRVLDCVDKGREASGLLQAGAINGLSIGYRILRSDRDPKGGRFLHEIDLWEISLVTFPMLPEAKIAAKSKALSDCFSQLTTAMHHAQQSWRMAPFKGEK